MKNKSPIASLFLSGKFHEVCQTLDSSKNKELQVDRSYWIGSLVFTGQIEKALALFNPDKISTSERIACRFYIILGYIRKSMYKEAKRELALNIREKTAKSTPLDQFYIYQGLAFYRFFCGRYLLAKKHASRSYSNAIKSRFLFGELISRDLLAHTLMQLGHTRESLKFFEHTLDQAQKNKNTWLSDAVSISILKFKAQLGIAPDKDLIDLENALLKLAPQDTYSIAELQLEMIRQYILRGKFSTAEHCFAQASELIYKHQNRRQLALLNIRMSYMLYLQGQTPQALHIVRLAAQNIDPNVDLNLWVQLLGLQALIEQDLKMGPSESRRKENKNVMSVQMAIHQKIMARKKSNSHFFPKNEDPIGDLLDLIASGDASAPRKVVEKGYYGLLHKCYKIPFGSQCLIFDLIPGSLVTLDKGNVTYKKKSLNSILRKILLLLIEKPQSKEELLENIWGYSYDPHRHDSLIYSAMNKVRTFLGPHSHWVELSENGYQIKSSVKVIIKKNLMVRPATNKVSPPKGLGNSPLSAKIKKASDLQILNIRQLQVLEYLKKNQSISIEELSGKLQISKPTANRDLSNLYKLGKVKRVGRGRATRYLI